MKKLFLSFFCIILVFSSISFANDDDFEELTWKEIDEITNVSAQLTDEPKINSRAAIVIEKNSKRILYEKNADKKYAMASTTKIMTAIIVIEKGNLKDTVEVSKKAGGTGGSRLGLKARR